MDIVVASLLSILDFGAGILIAGLCIIAWAAMDSRTKHCFRLVYLLLGLAGLALALDPFFGRHFSPYAHSALGLGVAIYMVLDRRRVRPRGGDAYVRITPDTGQRGFVFLEDLVALFIAGLIMSAILAPRDAHGQEAAAPSIPPTAEELKALEWMRANCAQGCAVLPVSQVRELAEAERRLREENERLRGREEPSKASCL